MRHIIYILMAMLLIGCGKDEEQTEVLRGLPGVWMLSERTYPSGDVEQYPINGRTWCSILDEDTTFYECQIQHTASGIVVIAGERAKCKLYDMGGNSMIYIINGQTCPLQIVNDSTIMLKKSGMLDVWQRNRSMSESRIDEIRNIVVSDTVNPNDAVMRYVLSTSERELKTTNHRLIYTLIAIVVILAVVVALSYRTVQKKRHIEKQLRHIREERELRPEPVAKVVRQMEEEFFSSAYYARLREQIKQGEFIKPKEWAELEQAIKPIYPNCVHHLLSLHNMSDTELRVCLLTKLRFTPKDMSGALCKSASSISSIRNRLYKKIFNENGGCKEWDEFIYSL